MQMGGNAVLMHFSLFAFNCGHYVVDKTVVISHRSRIKKNKCLYCDGWLRDVRAVMKTAVAPVNV